MIPQASSVMDDLGLAGGSSLLLGTKRTCRCFRRKSVMRVPGMNGPSSVAVRGPSATRSGHAQPLLDNLLPMRPRTYAPYRDMNSPPG